MLPNYVCWGGLESYQRGVTLTNFFVKMGKSFERFLRVSTHYLINAWLEKAGVLLIYVP